MSGVAEQMMTSNVYSFSGRVLIAGACLQSVSPEGYRRMAQQADQVYTLCLEQTHINMAVTKLSAVLGTGKVEKIIFASVDRSPHCTQMHYIKHELERILPEHIPIESYVLVDDEPIFVPDEAIELSKSLSRLSGKIESANR